MAQVPPDDHPGNSPEASSATRLDSWKEIAAYLSRDVATVRRWEKTEGLPIHRHHHHKLGSIYAFTPELDAWAEGRRTHTDRQMPVDSAAEAPPAGTRRWRVERVGFITLIVLVLLASAVLYVWMDRRSRKVAAAPAAISLAVLPFQPLGSAAHDEALELGMTDAVIMRLGALRQMRVRPLSSVRKYSDRGRDLEAAGRELGVDALVDARMQRDAGRIRVTAHVLRMRDGVLIPVGPFDEQFTNILNVQDAMSQQIARALAVTLTGDEARQLRRRETNNAEAYELYARGRHFLTPGVGDSVRKAVQCFERAIALDPSYALAHAALSSAYAAQANSTIVPSKDAYLAARREARRALDLDDSLAEAHTTIGSVSLLYDWDWAEAERAFTVALERERDDARTLRRYAIGLMWLGRFDEARTMMQRARDLAPVDLEVSANLALVLYYARQYDDAIAAARRTLEMDGGFSQAHRTMARSLVEQKRYDQAITAYQRAIAIGGVQLLEAELGHAYAISGRRSEALKILDRLRDRATKRYVSPYDMAIVHVGLGDHDRAFEWLRKSYAERERWMVTLKVAPALDPLRRDPRFAELMTDVGLWR